MPAEGQTGVVAVVPSADPVLTTVARRFPNAVRKGVPAHISLLYPFLPADEVDDDILASLSDLLQQAEPVIVRLAEIQRKDRFLALLPEPLDPLRTIISALRRQWPHLVPYDGRFGEVDPHVTVALPDSTDEVAVIANEILPPLLPITARLQTVWLVAFTGGRWTVRHTFTVGRG